MTDYPRHQSQVSLEERSRSPRYVVFLIALALLAAVYKPSRSLAQDSTDTPYVVMDTTKRDFGDVFAGEELTQIFYVRNAGTKPLELSEKSALGSRSTTADFSLTAALWSPTSRFLTRSVTARRAAPS